MEHAAKRAKKEAFFRSATDISKPHYGNSEAQRIPENGRKEVF